MYITEKKKYLAIGILVEKKENLEPMYSSDYSGYTCTNIMKRK